MRSSLLYSVLSALPSVRAAARALAADVRRLAERKGPQQDWLQRQG